MLAARWAARPLSCSTRWGAGAIHLEGSSPRTSAAGSRATRTEPLLRRSDGIRVEAEDAGLHRPLAHRVARDHAGDVNDSVGELSAENSSQPKGRPGHDTIASLQRCTQ